MSSAFEEPRSLFVNKVLAVHDLITVLYFTIFFMCVYCFGKVFLKWFQCMWHWIVLLLSLCVFFVPVGNFQFISLMEAKAEMIYLTIRDRFSKLIIV